MEKKSLENFNNNDIVKHMTDTEIDNKITQKIQQEYNYDLEAIRNLGAISKSLLTGKNYHNTVISESSISYKETTKKLCKANNDLETIDSKQEAIERCNSLENCDGFSLKINSNGAKKYILHNDIVGTTSIDATNTTTCNIKQIIEGSLKNNLLVIPANVKFLGNITVNGNSNIEGTSNVTGNLTVDGNAEIGNAYIGQSKAHGDHWAEFGHKDRGSEGGDYSFLSSSWGHTNVNAKEHPLKLAQSNVDKAHINKYSQFHINSKVEIDGDIHSKGIMTSSKWMNLVNKDVKYFWDGGDSVANIYAQRGNASDVTRKGGLVTEWGPRSVKHPNAGLFRFEPHGGIKGSPEEWTSAEQNNGEYGSSYQLPTYQGPT